MSLESRVEALEKKNPPASAGKPPPVRIYIPDNGRGPSPAASSSRGCNCSLHPWRAERS